MTVKPGYMDSAAVTGVSVIRKWRRRPMPPTRRRQEEDAVPQSERLMKTHFVLSLQDGQALASHFLVREKEIRSSPRTGKSWLQLGLADRTGNNQRKNVGQLRGDCERCLSATT